MSPLRTLCCFALSAALLAPPALAAEKAAKTTDSEAPTGAIAHEAENAVVKVFATQRHPDMARPWAKAAPMEVSGSGVVIEGKRILTNAHVVSYATQVQVQGSQSGDKVAATVMAYAPGIDLAVLKVEDESFFGNRPPLPRASSLPHVRDAVFAYGFPTGGTTLSITRGIVSRIEFTQFNSLTSGLRIQIDAAVNPGNSGGPAIADNKMIGLVFSHLRNAENISYIIPNEEIDLFLRASAEGSYAGKPGMWDELQTLENPALRGYLKLDKSVRGMVVHVPDEDTPGYPLKQWDVITHIAGTPIDDQGMVSIRSDLRVAFGYLIQQKAHAGRVPLTVVRDSRSQQVELPVPTQRPLLIDDLKGTYPSYFIYGPVVFERATLEGLTLMRARGGLSAIGSPLMARLGERPDPQHDDLVMIPAPLFPHALSTGYGDPTGSVLKSVNGTPVKSLAHLVSLLRDLKDPYVVLDFDNRISESMVFPREQIAAATEAILTDNGVRERGSADMLKVWNGE
jgi:S1-C subfamily serine protease